MDFFLLTGSNVGNPMDNLIKAERLIRSNAGEIKDASSVYVSGAWGITNQDAFLNRILKVTTSLNPQALMFALKEAERLIGRVKTEKWGPRVIDIDILFAENEIINQSELTIPHPEIQNRRFTLVPFAEIAPDFMHPVLEKTITQLLEETTDKGWVKKISNPLSWQQ